MILDLVNQLWQCGSQLGHLLQQHVVLLVELFDVLPKVRELPLGIFVHVLYKDAKDVRLGGLQVL